MRGDKLEKRVNQLQLNFFNQFFHRIHRAIKHGQFL